jgi:hypothetical protein
LLVELYGRKPKQGRDGWRAAVVSNMSWAVRTYLT